MAIAKKRFRSSELIAFTVPRTLCTLLAFAAFWS